MGACLSHQYGGSAAENLNSKELDAVNEAAFRTEQAKVKLLLLGAGESGKSTVFKQMKILYGAVPTDAEMRQMTPIIFVNIMVGIKALANQIILSGLTQSLTNQDDFRKIACMRDDTVISPEIAAILDRFWKDPITQSIWDKRSGFQIVDSVKTYLNDLSRISSNSYIPTQSDLLLCRVRTSGIATERYVIDNTVFEMYDVGGQRNERKKWIHCFDNVTAVMFVAALSEYDQTLFEDEGTNRMVEAIALFEEICNNGYFSSSSMILFLNKRDLFAEKISTIGIDSISHFSDYSGPAFNYDAGVQYFKKKFLAVNKNINKTVYHHVTCATDTSNIQVVFNACKDIILRGNLQETGFI